MREKQNRREAPLLTAPWSGQARGERGSLRLAREGRGGVNDVGDRKIVHRRVVVYTCIYVRAALVRDLEG